MATAQVHELGFALIMVTVMGTWLGEYGRIGGEAMNDKPKHDIEHQSAWEEGYQAGLHDLARGANPYPIGSDPANAWSAGLRGIAEIRKLEGN
jgi:hypothetical protein